jgi:hypothetical protein
MEPRPKLDKRLIEKSRWRPKPCDICGAKTGLKTLGRRKYLCASNGADYEIKLRDTLCERCGFVFAGETPDPHFLKRFYEDSLAPRSDRAIAPPAFDHENRLRALRKHLPRGASVLEIEANSEKSKGAAFDAVASYYVLGRALDARAWIRQAASRLKDGGFLFIEVADFEKFPAESLNKENLLHFTPYHLSRLLESCGFRVLKTDRQNASRYFGFLTVARLASSEAALYRDNPPLNHQAVGISESAYKKGLAQLKEKEKQDGRIARKARPGVSRQQ